MEWMPNPDAIQGLAGILSLNNRTNSEFISNSDNVGDWRWAMIP